LSVTCMARTVLLNATQTSDSRKLIRYRHFTAASHVEQVSCRISTKTGDDLSEI
jgi:hypothetical protein